MELRLEHAIFYTPLSNYLIINRNNLVIESKQKSIINKKVMRIQRTVKSYLFVL